MTESFVIDAPANAPLPTTAPAAQNRLDGLMSSPDWGKRLTSGDAAARIEFDSLTKTITGFNDPPPRNDEATRASLDAFRKATAAGEHPAIVAKAMREAAGSGDNAPTIDQVIALSKSIDHAHMANEIVDVARKQFDISDDVVEQIRGGQPVSQAEYDAVSRLKSQRTNDPVWSRELLEGKPGPRRELFLMSIVLSSSVAA